MKRIVKKIIYRSIFSAGSYYDLLMVPGSGSLRIRSEDTDNGRLLTYELDATISRRISREGSASLEGDLQIIVTYDNNTEARLGTTERPARLLVDDQDTMRVSCRWQDVI
ncbi:MAG: hypothetical protein K6E35_07825 [Bacteroidales bacterium]|nr:hypothetical protein [Bacteroidales bacterium]